MNHKKIITGAGIVVIVSTALVIVFLALRSSVTTFEECVAAGNPVMQSLPLQCLHDKRVFIEGVPGYVQYPKRGNVRNEIGDIHVPIQDEFENKIVYSVADGNFNEALYRDHCEKRGGTFNTCGSVCDEDEICIQVCALTCEF